ncbi:MAG: hypothetical protein ACD_3C00180G0002 [uncultured bacterium (gcode 4)]|uniref:LamG-like jellyroll fold domain-containing protein n=1 Tax=uncultured bacterium (gcode 4) TaxID=1234023 RepID=K2F9A8_9BACT|nr:MAG: hypothetical protein ACD_3C00180G0002 [uncultured bacterium (gcode 4)]
MFDADKFKIKWRPNQMKSISAFTLVELIVVIVILAILATIAFMSFSSQSISARDSTRLTDMSNIAKWLSVFNATSWRYPAPDNPISITASWILLWQQWYAGANVLNMIKISWWWKDPLDNLTYYTYSTNSNQSKFQLLWFLEDGSNNALSLIPFVNKNQLTFLSDWIGKVNADLSSYSWRYLVSKWDNIWILLNNSTLVPVQSANSPIDLVKAQSGTSYKAIFWNENSWNNISMSWSDVFTNLYFKNNDLIRNPSLGIFDESLVWLWDMETLSWTSMKDLSRSNLNWVIYWSWMQSVSGKLWQARKFNGINDYIQSWDTEVGDLLTVSVWIKPDDLSASRPIICKKHSTVTSWCSFHLIVNTTWKVLWSYTSSGNYYFNTTTIQSHVKIWQWTHIVYQKGVWWKNAQKIFINWILVQTWIFSYPSASTDSTTIDNSSNPTKIWNDVDNLFFNGSIDDLRIYNRVLSDSEILWLYNSLR